MVVAAVQPPSFNTTEANASPRQPLGRSTSRDAQHPERPTPERPPASIDHLRSLGVAANAPEKPVGDERSDALVDQPLTIVAFVTIDESSVTEATPSPSLNLTKDGAASIRQPVAKPASKCAAFRTSDQRGIAWFDRESACPNRQKGRYFGAKASAGQAGPHFRAHGGSNLPPPGRKPCAKQNSEKSVLDLLSDSRADHALSVITGDKPNAVGAVPSLSANGSEAVGPLRKTISEPTSRDILPSAPPTQKDLPSLIEHAISLVKGIVISERSTVLVKKAGISEFNGVNNTSPSLSKALIDHGPSTTAIVPIGETNAIEAASPPSLNTARTEPLSLQRPFDRCASKDVLHSEPRSGDRAHPAEGAPTALTAESAASLPAQPPVGQLSPEDRLDIELADIRRRVALFKEHQQRFRRDREEYYAATIARSIRLDASDRSSG
jgi:hypothetical protein